MSNRSAIEAYASEEHRHAHVLPFSVNNVKTHILKQLCLGVPAHGAYSVCQRWAAMHGSQIRPVTGPSEGQAERVEEHLKRHILLWRPEKPSFTEPALIWITFSLSASYFLYIPPSSAALFPHTQRKGIISTLTAFCLHFKSSFRSETSLWCLHICVCDLNLLWVMFFRDYVCVMRTREILCLKYNGTSMLF